MSNIVLFFIAAIISYCIGSINWALIISKLNKKDIRKMGSGNPGTLNMSRNLGLKWGLFTFFLDIMKGALPTLGAFFFFKSRGVFDGTEFQVFDLAIYVCGLAVILGHIYPVFLKFKGGKGIASTIGVLFICEAVHGGAWFVVALMALVAAAAFIYLTEFGAMGSFIAITPPAISGGIRLFLTYLNGNGKTSLFCTLADLFILLICFFTWFAHRKNIERMLAGDEHPTSIKQMAVKKKLKKAAEKEAEKDNSEEVISVKKN